MRDEQFFTLQNQILNKIQRSSDISVITTNKDKEQIYNIMETMNHNNKPIEIRNKIGTPKKENFQTHATKIILKKCAIAVITQPYYKKVVVLKKLKHPSHLHARL